MALNDIKTIKEATRVEKADGYDYSFPKAVITTNTAGNYMNVLLRNTSVSTLVRFGEITNKLGATNINDYVDKLAEAGEYGEKYNPATETLGTSQASSNYEVVSSQALQSIDAKLNDLIFLLKAIAE